MRHPLESHLSNQILGGNMDKAELGRTMNNLYRSFGQRFGANYEVRSGTEIIVGKGNDARLADLGNSEVRRTLAKMMMEDLSQGLDHGRTYAQSLQRSLNGLEQQIRAATNRANRSRSSADIQEVQRLQGQADRYHKLLMPSQAENLTFFARVPDRVDVPALFHVELFRTPKRCARPRGFHRRQLADGCRFY